jgi:hypothetical protein
MCRSRSPPSPARPERAPHRRCARRPVQHAEPRLCRQRAAGASRRRQQRHLLDGGERNAGLHQRRLCRREGRERILRSRADRDPARPARHLVRPQHDRRRDQPHHAAPEARFRRRGLRRIWQLRLDPAEGRAQPAAERQHPAALRRLLSEAATATRRTSPPAIGASTAATSSAFAARRAWRLARTPRPIS